jgi:hypothetical protein
MSISIQQIRSAIPGAQPAQLDPGQVAFNVSDGTMYLGTGTDSKIDFSGELVLPAPPAGKGWLQVLLQRSSLNDFFLANPESQGRPAPENEQVLTWNATDGVAEWQDAGTGFAYSTTSDTVAGSTGATTSEKISAAIGSPSYIGKNASCIVTGDPGSQYEGLYIWDGTEWLFASHYAFNTASQVPALNPMTLASQPTQEVLGALKDVDVNLQGQITANDGEIATLQGEVSQAQTDILSLQVNKLDKAGNTPTSGQILSFDGAGQLWVDNSAGDVTSVSGVAPINVDNTNPQTPIVSVALATNGNAGVVQIGTNINNNVGTISVADSSTSGKGVVQLVNTLDSTSTTQALTAAAGAALQTQINALSLASNVTLAGGYDAQTGLMDSVTSQGLAAGFAVGDPLPDPTTVTDYYVIVTNAGTQLLLGAKANGDAENGDWYLSDGIEWQLLGVGARPGTASYTSAGIVQLADASVVYAGTSDTEAITPDALFSNMSDSVVLADSHKIASSLAVKTASDTATTALNSATTANNAANAAQSTADQAVLDAAAAQAAADNAQSAAEGAQATADAAIPLATVTAAGDLIIGSGNATVSRLGIGANNTYLSVAGGNLVWGQAPVSLIGITNGEGVAPYSTALGFGAGDAASVTGFYNVSVGYNAGSNITSGDYNVGIGSLSMQGNGTNNTAVGHASQGSTAATGQGNSSLGYQTLDALTSGQFNIGVGFAAGSSVTSGSRNTFVGYRAGALVTTGVNNTIIGNVEGTQSMGNMVVIADGDGDVRFQANANGAVSFNGVSYGSAGQVLTSNGQGSAVTWSSSVPMVTAPTASTDAGSEGQIAADATYFYLYSGGSWKRVQWDATPW